jgi:transcriptional regulator with XRE-family HTH domain
MFTRIYDVRTLLKIKQDELSRLTGVSQSQISKYEKGEVVNPSFDKLVKIAEALGVTVDDLKTKQDGIGEEQPIRQTTSSVFVPLYAGRATLSKLDTEAVRLGFNRVANQQIRKPTFLEYSDTAYACVNYGQAMYPRYNDGDIMYVDPTIAPQKGDDVVVAFRCSDGVSYCGVVREFVSQDETKLHIRAVGNDYSATLDRSDIHSVSVIVGSQKGRFAM